MNQPVRARHFIALFAAYVVALQALLLPLSLGVGGTLGAGLCAAAQSVENSSLPAGDTSGCPCAAGCGMPCCIHALGGPPQTATVFVALQSAAAAPIIAPDHVIHISDRRQPQIPRAPPFA
jgi:drug/metabolite transporter (DMT)-like permease